MLETARFEARRHVKQAIGVSIGMLAFVGMIIGLFPSIEAAGAEMEAYVEALPESVTAAVGGADVPIATIEGFLVIEVYRFIWMLVLGAYFAYAAASLIAGERERRSIDLLVTLPIPRRRIVFEKFCSMIPDAVLVNVVTALGVLVLVPMVGENIDAVWVIALHAVSIVYLLACVAFGLLLSTLIASERRAQIAGFGGVAVMYLLEAVTRDTDVEWLGDPLFPRHFDPNALLIDQEMDWDGTLTLLAMTLVLLWLAILRFERTDITT